MGSGLLMEGGLCLHRDIDPNMSIFRCMKLEYLIDLLETKRLYCRRIIDWEDPWEMPSKLIEVKFQGTDPHITSPINMLEICNRAKDHLYGMSWTSTYDSDALWRIYSPLANGTGGVCIKTTPQKLNDRLGCFFPLNSFVDIFLGPVNYEKNRINDAWKILISDAANYYPYYMYPAFVKRGAFEHEKEIRLAIYNPTVEYEPGKGYLGKDKKGLYIPLGSLDFIEELILDPRIDDSGENMMHTQLACYGFPINKSDLYNTPPIVATTINTATTEAYRHQTRSAKGELWYYQGKFHRISEK